MPEDLSTLPNRDTYYDNVERILCLPLQVFMRYRIKMFLKRNVPHDTTLYSAIGDLATIFHNLTFYYRKTGCKHDKLIRGFTVDDDVQRKRLVYYIIIQYATTNIRILQLTKPLQQTRNSRILCHDTSIGQNNVWKKKKVSPNLVLVHYTTLNEI